MRKIRSFVILFVTVMVLLSGFLSPAQYANASSYNGYWPWSGRVKTENYGTRHVITLEFRLNELQLMNLREIGEYLEIDFIAYNAGIRGDSRDYRFYTNIGSARKDIPFLDRTFTPGATAIETQELSAGTDYYVTVAWNSDYAVVPEISVDFVPSGWAGAVAANDKSYGYSSNGPIQTVSCSWGIINDDIGWCIFPIERHKLLATLYGGLVSSDGTTYSLDPSVLDRLNTA